MAGVLKYLNIELRLATQDFNNGLKAAQREAKEFEKTIKPMKEVLQSLGVAASAVGLAVVGSLTAMAKASADYGDALNDASKRTGASVEELAKLKFAAEQSGASFDDVSTGLRMLAVNANAAAEGSKNQAKAFADLGIKVTDAAGKVRPMNDLLLDVADKFKGMEDGAEKSALAVELFGRGGTALIPTLNEGRDGLKKMGDQAERLGLVISKDAAEASDAFNDSMGELKSSMMGLSNAVGEAILPALTSLARLLTDGVVTIRNFAKEHEYLTKAALVLGGVLAGAGGLVVSITSASMAFASIMPVITALKPLAASLAAGFTAIGGALTVLSGVAIAGALIQLGRMALAFRDLWNAQNSLIMAQADATLSEQKAIKVLAEHGYHVKLAGLSTAERAKAIGQATQAMAAELRATQKAKEETKQHTSAVTAQAGAVKMSTAALDKHADGLREVTRALQDQYGEMRRVEDQFRGDWDRILDRRSDEWLKGEKERVEATRKAAHDIAVIQSHENDGLMAQMKDLEDLAKDGAKVRIETEKSVGAEAKKQASEFSRAWETAIGNISSRFSDNIADMIVEWDFGWKGMVDIVKDTAKSLLSSFISGFITPALSQVAGLGAKLGDIVFGGKSGGSGISLPGSNSGGGNSNGGGGGGGGGMFSGANIGGFFQAADTVVNWLGAVGEGRRAANQVIKSQESVWNSIADIYNKRDATSLSSLVSARSLINQIFSDWQKNLEAFAGNNESNQVVANQAFAELNKHLTLVRKDLEDNINALGGDPAGGGMNSKPIVDAIFESTGMIRESMSATAHWMIEQWAGANPVVALAVAAEPQNVTITISAPLTIQMSERIDRRTFREDIMPEWIAQMETNIEGALEKLRALANGPVTAPAES